MHLDSDIELFDIKINFQYKNYHFNESIVMDYAKSKKCSNCYIWDYKVNLFLPPKYNESKHVQKPIIKYEENRCGSKLLLDNKIPSEIAYLYKEILNLETK